MHMSNQSSSPRGDSYRLKMAMHVHQIDLTSFIKYETKNKLYIIIRRSSEHS